MRKLITLLFTSKKELILYGISGLIATGSNLAVFFILYSLFGLNSIYSNSIAFIIAVALAYILNRKIVFNRVFFADNIHKQAISFFSLRTLSGLFDIIFVFVFIDLASYPAIIIKPLSNIIIIVINFFLSKFIIFK